MRHLVHATGWLVVGALTLGTFLALQTLPASADPPAGDDTGGPFDTGGIGDPDAIDFVLEEISMPSLDMPGLSTTALTNLAAFVDEDPPAGEVDLSSQLVDVATVEPAWQAVIDADRDPGVLQSRVVEVDLEAAALALGTTNGKVRLELFEDVELTLAHESVQMGKDSATWFARLGSGPRDRARLSWVGDRLRGEALVGKNLVEIVMVEDDTFVVLELDGDRMGREAPQTFGGAW